MDSAISRILSQGMVDGDGPRSLAGKIVDATGVSRRRAMTLARTEIIRAHHSAMVQEYKNWAVEGVVVKAEWVDAGFNVCPDCAKNNGKIFDLNEIEGLIPLHPNCRCIALPTMPEKGVKTVEKVQEKVIEKEIKNDADKLAVELTKRGIDNHYSESNTDFGTSRYFTFYKDKDSLDKLVVRISDHSVSNTTRMANEVLRKEGEVDAIKLADTVEIYLHPDRFVFTSVEKGEKPTHRINGVFGKYVRKIKEQIL
jgi:SPP1 gp7 family putative phage head morphogenesis protein